MSLPNHPTYSSLFSKQLEDTATVKTISKCVTTMLDDFKSKHNIKQLLTTRCEIPPFPPWLQTMINIDTSLSSVKKNDISVQQQQTSFSNFLEKYDGYRRLYTDGSKTENGAGCAFVELEENMSFLQILSPLSSVLTTELYAILEAVKYTKTITFSQPQKFLVMSDSLSGLTAIENQGDNPLLFDISAQLQNSPHNIIMAWIPGHSGIIGNETADIIAKSCCNPNSPPLHTHFVPPQDLKKALQSHINDSWEDYWMNNDKNLLQRRPKPYDNTSFNKHRTCEVQIARLRIGHTFFSHSHLISKSPVPLCSLCQHSPLTIDHILLSCPKTYATRIKIRSSLPLNMHPLCSDSPIVVTEILKLFKKLNLKI
ncbi:uncharacterized protein [Bemisia tabaci]|uniref:uncharacterized protein n=1 Tax=Bemisia tabaci TaxID=7038 RepID=UPI003B28690D